MKRTELKQLNECPEAFSGMVTVCGWIKSLRTGKGIAFISISDGSCFTPVQIVAEADRLGISLCTVFLPKTALCTLTRQ